MNPIIGSIVALVTPMQDDGSIDYDALRRLIDWHIAEGTDCIGVVGTTGESPTVSVEEHCEVIRVAVEHESSGQAGHDRDQRRPVRFACGRQLHASKPRAARIASTGASTPVQSRNDAAPCRTRASRPSTTSRQPASRAAAISAVGRPSAL